MSVTAKVNYHLVKNHTQAFHFDVDGIAGNMLSPELEATKVYVKDLRDRSCEVAFNDDGITFKVAPSKVQHFSSDQQWRSQYDQEIVRLLKQTIAVEEVLVFDHTVRIDDLDATRKPARNVHNDYSSNGANQRLIDLLGPERAISYQQGHFAFVNIWRPVEFAIKSSPLGFILPSTMQPNDWMTIDLVYPDRRGEVLGVAANPNHEWFYLSQMTPDEVAIFNIYDNRGQPFLAHSALDIIGESTPNHPRKSIETRTLVKYA